MIRIICTEVCRGNAAHVGGPPEVTCKTFDVEVPEVEQWLREPKVMNDHYTDRTITGYEVLEVKE